MLGFTYNGKHSDELKINYVPDAAKRGEIMTDYEVLDNERSWFPGGDYYKARVKSKLFELPCYYEDITRKEFENIAKWVACDTKGYLIFDQRPYARYFVVPTKRIEPRDYGFDDGMFSRHSGTLTITFTAYYPFAELLYDNADTAPLQASNEVSLLPAAEMPGNSALNKTDMVIYNPGTKLGNSIIRFAGSTGSDDLTITNVTTGDVCVIKKGTVTAENSWLEFDSKTGRVETVTQSGRVLNFVPHGKGYICFAPNEVIADQCPIQQTSGSKIITSAHAFKPEYLGMYIYVDSGWRYIGTYTSDASISMNVNAAATKSTSTKIATMNYLTISKANNASITQLDIICKPEVR